MKTKIKIALGYIFNNDQLDTIESLHQQKRYNDIRYIVSAKRDEYDNRIHCIATKPKDTRTLKNTTIQIEGMCDIIEDYYIDLTEKNKDHDRKRI